MTGVVTGRDNVRELAGLVEVTGPGPAAGQTAEVPA
jgi:hypothetical protein